MDSENCRQYASERRTVEISVPLRLMGVIALILALCGNGGCIATRLKATSNRPVDASMEVFVRASIEQHSMDSVCLFPFTSPPEMAAASDYLTTAFQTRLVQRRPFREIRTLPYEVKSDSEALWYARNEGCTLAMRPSLVYMMDGTGAMPTELVVRTRILDARTGQVLWDIKQNAQSEPGYDIDLTWNTFTGEPAQRRRVMADCLAQRFAEYLVKPLVKEQ
ncbi:MAG: hypothetical protein ABSF52_07185 [Syntrophobacteraceae bacterium]|jgi:hypothetical protein